MKMFMKLTVAALVLVNVGQAVAFSYPPECIEMCSMNMPVMNDSKSSVVSQISQQNCLSSCMQQVVPVGF